MSDTPHTDKALDSLDDAEFVTEYTEGSNQAKRLTPTEIEKLHDLENKIAAQKRQSSNGIYRRVF